MRTLFYALGLASLPLLAVLPALAAQVGADVKPLPHSSGPLRAMMALTDDLAEARRIWEESESNPKLTIVSQARPGDAVSTLIVLQGCQPDRAGHCDVDAQFSLEVPGGERVDAGAGKLWAGAPQKALISLGNASASVEVASDWAKGSYIFHAVITDRVADRSLALAAPFEVSLD